MQEQWGTGPTSQPFLTCLECSRCHYSKGINTLLTFTSIHVGISSIISWTAHFLSFPGHSFFRIPAQKPPGLRELGRGMLEGLGNPASLRILGNSLFWTLFPLLWNWIPMVQVVMPTTTMGSHPEHLGYLHKGSNVIVWPIPHTNTDCLPLANTVEASPLLPKAAKRSSKHSWACIICRNYTWT